MKLPRVLIGVSLALLFRMGAGAAPLPPDVRPGHWSAPAVTRILNTGVLHVQPDGQFHGDAKVTRAEAVTALAALARKLVDSAWESGGRSKPVPDSVSSLWAKTNWKAEPVRRYAFAAIVTRFGDYVTNGAKRPAPNTKTGQSEAIPPVSVTFPHGSPAYDALKYLADNRMIRPGSPLLKPDSSPLLGADLSRALADLATGINDRFTELGIDDDAAPAKPQQKRP